MINGEYNFCEDPEPLIATVARLFAAEGAAREVAILAVAKPTIRQTGYESNFSDESIYFSLYLQLPVKLYGQLNSVREECEESIKEKVNEVLRPLPREYIERVYISPQVEAEKEWRSKALAWLAGDGISNQGRVRSDNLPSRIADGLLFRSQPEIHLYKALKSLGVSFAPLPVFVRGGEQYKRIEPDFVIIKDGVVLVVEVDGDTVHTETPSEAHSRTTMLVHEGVRLERINASECETQELANVCAKKILQIISKMKTLK